MARDFPDSYTPEPIDRVAGRVLSRGYHHEFKKGNNNRESWDIPPEVIPAVYTPEDVKKLIGERKGALVVVGYLGHHQSAQKNNKKDRLLVRCDCGKYEVRVARRWRKNNEIDNRCQFCDLKEDLKVRHLSHEERDRLENQRRLRVGLPTKQDEMTERLKTRLFNFYARGRDPGKWKKHRRRLT